MFLNLTSRTRAIVSDIEQQLFGMALDPRLMPGVAHELRSHSSIGSFRSSASTPSLRSREGSVTPIGDRMAAPGGNVKVVVRVRGFLPRGLLRCLVIRATLTFRRGRKGSRMSS